jgi:segregation and condensation protein A
MHMLVNETRIYFSSFFKKAANKMEIVVTFLAILELIRLKEIIIVQREPFGEIELTVNTEMAKPAI